jgi:hypothetical protein
MSVSSFSRKRFGLPALALFLAASTFPRPAVFFHTHAGGEAAHVHGEGELFGDHDHEEQAAGHEHRHDDDHLAQHGRPHEAAFDEAGPVHRGHWHTQNPYPLAARVEAAIVVPLAAIDSLSRSPIPGILGRFTLATRARSPPSTAKL